MPLAGRAASLALLVCALAAVWWATHTVLAGPSATAALDFEPASLGVARTAVGPPPVAGSREDASTAQGSEPVAAAADDGGTSAVPAQPPPPPGAAPGGQESAKDAVAAVMAGGCRACVSSKSEATFASEMPRGGPGDPVLVCQTFWHRRFPGRSPEEMWPHCLKAATAERVALRAKLCQLCRDTAAQVAGAPPTPTGAPKRGVLYSIGVHHVDLVRAGIRNLRRNVGYTGAIEVYCDQPQCVDKCRAKLEKELSVACVKLEAKFTVRYASKLLAVLQTTLDHVLMVDADNMLVLNPDVVFDSPAVAEHGRTVGWPDLWGAACRRTKWGKTEDNPSGLMMAGQSGRPDHILWPVLDLAWRPQYEYTTELTSSIIVVNKRSPLAVAAWRLATWMTERDFWTKVLYGDKDTIRVSMLLLGAPFEMAPQPADQVLFSDDEGKSGRRIHLINRFGGKIVSLDQIKHLAHKSKPWVVVQVKKEAYRDANDSYCAPDYHRYTDGGSKVKVHFDWDPPGLHATVKGLLEKIYEGFEVDT